MPEYVLRRHENTIVSACHQVLKLPWYICRLLFRMAFGGDIDVSRILCKQTRDVASPSGIKSEFPGGRSEYDGGICW